MGIETCATFCFIVKVFYFVGQKTHKKEKTIISMFDFYLLYVYVKIIIQLSRKKCKTYFVIRN